MRHRIGITVATLGLVILSGGTAPGTAAAPVSDAQVINANLYEWGIDFDQSTVVVGQTIRFEIVNTGQIEHQIRIALGNAQVGQTDIVAAGGRSTLEVAFPQAGNYRVTCPLETDDGEVHTALGMLTSLGVEGA